MIHDLDANGDGRRLRGPVVISRKGPGVRTHESYDTLRDLRALLSWRSEDAVLLAEADVPPKTDLESFGESGERPRAAHGDISCATTTSSTWAG